MTPPRCALNDSAYYRAALPAAARVPQASTPRSGGEWRFRFTSCCSGPEGTYWQYAMSEAQDGGRTARHTVGDACASTRHNLYGTRGRAK